MNTVIALFWDPRLNVQDSRVFHGDLPADKLREQAQQTLLRERPWVKPPVLFLDEDSIALLQRVLEASRTATEQVREHLGEGGEDIPPAALAHALGVLGEEVELQVPEDMGDNVLTFPPLQKAG